MFPTMILSTRTGSGSSSSSSSVSSHDGTRFRHSPYTASVVLSDAAAAAVHYPEPPQPILTLSVQQDSASPNVIISTRRRNTNSPSSTPTSTPSAASPPAATVALKMQVASPFLPSSPTTMPSTDYAAAPLHSRATSPSSLSVSDRTDYALHLVSQSWDHAATSSLRDSPVPVGDSMTETSSFQRRQHQPYQPVPIIPSPQQPSAPFAAAAAPPPPYQVATLGAEPPSSTPSRSAYARQLSGKLRYIELPTEAELSTMALPGIGTEIKTDHGAFFGQIRYDVTERQMIWLVLHLTQCQPLFLHTRNRGCFQAYFRTAEEAAAVRQLNQRLLSDRSGFWFAQCPEETILLTSFCADKQPARGLPNSAVVIRR